MTSQLLWRYVNMYQHWLCGASITLFIKRSGITITFVQSFGVRISSVQTVPKCLSKLYILSNCEHIFPLLSPCDKSYFISNGIYCLNTRFAHSLTHEMMGCTWWNAYSSIQVQNKCALKVYNGCFYGTNYDYNWPIQEVSFGWINFNPPQKKTKIEKRRFECCAPFPDRIMVVRTSQ